jgi:hypothetical protein
VALAFLNDSCTSTHGNIRVDSVFLSPSGEWKLRGFEVLSNPKDDTSILYVSSATLSIYIMVPDTFDFTPTINSKIDPFRT